MKYYREALRVADEVGMDPFSDEIIGVKIQIAALMEKVQQYQKAIGILEIVKADNMKWVDKFGSVKGNEGRRTRILGKTVGVSVKLGELYANEFVLEKENAEERLVWAVETVLKEQQRREKEGVKEGEGEWLSAEEIGGSFEGLFTSFDDGKHEVGRLTENSTRTALRGKEPALSRCPSIPSSFDTITTCELSYRSTE